jgi:hypothetical protein
MINHARTLLLNIFAQSTSNQDAAYEYISPTYRPLVLPTYLKTMRRALFGSRPDQRFLNLRVRELMSYIHQTELSDYAYKLDSRVTYWPEQSNDFLALQPRITIRQASGALRNIAVGGEFVANNATGRASRQFVLTLVPSDGDATTASAITQENGQYIQLENAGLLLQETAIDSASFNAQSVRNYPTLYANSDVNQVNTFPTIELPETAIKLRPDTLTTDPATLTGKWMLQLTANPAPAITTLLPTLELMGEPLFLELFGVADEEPYATFKNVWFDHPLPAYRLAGLTMALIYRTEEVRLNSNG